jgi:hypothetical protein
VTLAARLAAVTATLIRGARLGPGDGLTCLLAWILLHAAVLRLRFGLWVPGHLPGPDPWEAAGRPGPCGEKDRSRARRLAELLNEAARRPALGLWCLPRALALRQLLRLHGIDCQLALGLRRGDGGLSGHAWVVYHGAVLGQDDTLVGTFDRCQVA